MSRFTIATYRADPGNPANHETLRDLIAQHHMTLRVEGLVSSRPPLLLHAADGTFVEIFEWANDEAASQAHSNERVQALWAKMGEVANFPPLADVAGCDHPFPHFAPVKL